MTLQAFFVDAFTNRQFSGNQAALIPLENWLDAPLMQSIAAEHNLAETAFFVPQGADFELRWFTPKVEVDLCGHATLAAAFVLRECLGHGADTVRFHTRSGELAVTWQNGWYTLDFPARPALPVAEEDLALRQGLGGEPVEILAARDYLVRFRTAAEVRALQPDFARLKQAKRFAVIATAPGEAEGIDFVSRFFAPAQGIDEDPVTGSAHCTLIPYWADQLGKQTFRARQISERGGDLRCEWRGERVAISGQAVLFAKSEIYIPG
ncbi:MAG: PhzF family phenazine biosynthesis protein [Bryobacter sp.]|nr:PhzF family phenazine biosynthesis protein [Bryobacter sp.]